MRTLASSFLLATIVAILACGGGDDDGDPTATSTGNVTGTEDPATATATETGNEPGPPASLVVASSELAVGQNRFIFGLFDAENRLVDDAEATLTLYRSADTDPVELGTFDVEFRQIEYPDAEAPPDINGVYAADLEFSEAGTYGVRINVQGQGEAPQGLRVFIQVQEGSSGVQVGDPAPASDNPTAEDVEDLATIDSDEPPNPQFHELSIAQALASGRPTLVSFATPAFCTSRLCGPMIDVLLALYPEYEGEVNFIHVEPFELDSEGQVILDGERFVTSQTFDEWGLSAEPVTFLIGADSIVVYRFESVVTQAELREALDTLLN
ncbi:MAG: hypothetical protein WEB00_10000 [Dehalococcoidia bacterium]